MSDLLEELGVKLAHILLHPVAYITTDNIYYILANTTLNTEHKKKTKKNTYTERFGQTLGTISTY
jgi:hypothetical protein